MESRVQRVEVPATIASARPYDYASAFVPYDSRAARPLWAVAAAIHHRTIPFLLGHAAYVAALDAVPS